MNIMTDEEILAGYKLWVNTAKEVRKCNVCNGDGWVVEETLISFHNGEYKYTNKGCSYCNGSGLVMDVRRTVSVYPVSGIKPLNYTIPYDPKAAVEEAMKRNA